MDADYRFCGDIRSGDHSITYLNCLLTDRAVPGRKQFVSHTVSFGCIPLFLQGDIFPLPAPLFLFNISET